MATIIIKTNASQATDILIRDLGFVIPSDGGFVTFTDLDIIQEIKLSSDLRIYATDDTFGVNSSTIILNDGTNDIPQSNLESFLTEVGSTNKSSYSLAVVGKLSSISLPQIKIGSEIINESKLLTSFKAIRGVAGENGTTTIQLEINGNLVGSSLSWTTSDSDDTLKSVAISVSVTIGDILTFRVTSAEKNAYDLFLNVS